MTDIELNFEGYCEICDVALREDAIRKGESLCIECASRRKKSQKTKREKDPWPEKY